MADPQWDEQKEVWRNITADHARIQTERYKKVAIHHAILTCEIAIARVLRESKNRCEVEIKKEHTFKLEKEFKGRGFTTFSIKQTEDLNHFQIQWEKK